MHKLQKFSRSRAHSKSSSYSGNRNSMDLPETDTHSRPDMVQTDNSSLTKHSIASGLLNSQMNGLFKSSPATQQRTSRHTPTSSTTGVKAGTPSPSINPTLDRTPGKGGGGAGEEDIGGSTSNVNASAIAKMSSTIRPVRSFDASDSSCDSPSARNSDFSSSVNSATSNTSYSSQSQSNGDSTPRVRLKHSPVAVAATPEQPPPSLPNGSSRRGISENALSPRDALSTAPNTHDHHGQEHWDSSVGKAGLGKTGRVINKLVSDNEALKRDIKIERLKAEEAKQAARLLEDKMERMAADFEARLLEAQVTKTLLARKERQVETLSGQVDQEKKKAVEALSREKNWRDEMEKLELAANCRVEEAENKSMMFEGRYNALSGHWKNQGDEVKKATSKLKKDIAGLVEERKRDDDKISVLRDLCDQQDSNIRELKEQKDAIARQFEAYKVEQERSLQDIKARARETEEEQAVMLAETKEVLDKLKWALNVNKMNIAAK